MDESAAPSPDALHLNLDGFEGPLDLLLDLARRQRVDLATISILTLVDQYVAAAADRTHPARAVDWLVMAAWLAWLKSRLLLPKAMDGAAEGEQAAQSFAGRLTELDRVKAIAAWLEARPRLGRDMFEKGRGEAGPGPVVTANLASLFLACIDVLRGQPMQAPQAWRPPRGAMWTPHQAIARIQAMLAVPPAGADLLGFLPEIAADLPDCGIHLKAAISSTLVASLELARDAQAEVEQSDAFGTILVRRAAASRPAK